VNLDDLPRLEFADPGPARDQVVAAILAHVLDDGADDQTAVLAQRFRLVAT